MPAIEKARSSGTYMTVASSWANLPRSGAAASACWFPGERMCVVVGDVCRARRKHGRHRVEPLHAHILVQGQEMGFEPLAAVIWKKIANVTT
jgi:hypothetical protein